MVCFRQSARVIDTTDAPQIIEHVNKPIMFTPYDVRWVPCSARLAVMGMYPRGTGSLQVYEMNVGSLNLIAEVRRRYANASGWDAVRYREANPGRQRTPPSWP